MFSEQKGKQLISQLDLNSPFAIYGCGQFTKAFLQYLQSRNHPLPEVILDDTPKTNKLHSVPVQQTSSGTLADLSQVILSTDTFIHAMTQKLFELRYGQNIIFLRSSSPELNSPFDLQKTVNIGKNLPADIGNKAYIFLHLLKTGGTSLADLFIRNMDCHLVCSNRNPSLAFRLYQERQGSFQTNDRIFISGHDSWGAHMAFPNRTCCYITMLREPLSRAISHFNFQNQYWSADHFDEFANRFTNLYTREIGNGDFETAKRNIEQMFDSVLIYEQYQDSVNYIAKRYGIHGDIKYLNRSRKSADASVLSQESIRQFYRKNEADVELYRLAEKEFNKRIHQYSLPNLCHQKEDGGEVIKRHYDKISTFSSISSINDPKIRYDSAMEKRSSIVDMMSFLLAVNPSIDALFPEKKFSLFRLYLEAYESHPLPVPATDTQLRILYAGILKFFFYLLKYEALMPTAIFRQVNHRFRNFIAENRHRFLNTLKKDEEDLRFIYELAISIFSSYLDRDREKMQLYYSQLMEQLSDFFPKYTQDKWKQLDGQCIAIYGQGRCARSVLNKIKNLTKQKPVIAAVFGRGSMPPAHELQEKKIETILMLNDEDLQISYLDLFKKYGEQFVLMDLYEDIPFNMIPCQYMLSFPPPVSGIHS